MAHRFDFLGGGGEMGARIRAFDWTRTPLGPPEGWPASLRTAVRIMLTSRQPIWVGWGPALTYLYNDPYQSIVGGKHPEALGQPVGDVWSEIWDVVGPMADVVMQRDEGTYVEAQLLIMQRYGYAEETYYTFSYSPIPGDDGRPGGIICANTDDTRRVIGERQLALLRELASATAEARSFDEACLASVKALETNGRDVPFALIYAVEAGRTSLAAAAGIDAGHAAARPDAWPLAEALGAADPRVVELPVGLEALPHGAWSRPPRAAAVVPVGGTQGQRSLVLVVGLNPFRRFDDAYRGCLELAAAQIGVAVANAEAYDQERRRAEALAELDRAKTMFFTNVSHEFRTPLTLMLGPVRDALSSGELPAGSREMLELVQRNGMRLLKLVNTLLDFARLEAGRIDARYEPTDLAAFTAELASSFRSASERAGLRLVVDTPAFDEPVWIDREMWEKVVLNLLSNAFKFTLAGEIAVRVERAGGRARLTVRDTGTGIPPAELAHVFDRFHRVAGSGGRTHEGTGIGLALVSELVHLHGGEVGVESRLGEGSTFTVAIPFGSSHLPADHVVTGQAAPAEARGAGAYVEEALRWLPRPSPDAIGTEEERPPSRRAGASDTRPRVLLAEDNRDMRDYVSRILGERFAVEAVADGEEALQVVLARPPELVLSDVMMPRRDGTSLLKALRDDERTRTIPFVLLSARAGEDARIDALNLGADDYLVKPFSARELVAVVAAQVATARLRGAGEKASREREALFRAMADTAPAMLWVTDPFGACTYLSRDWLAFTGQTAEEGLGFGWTDAVHPDDRDAARAAFSAASAHHEPWSCQYRLRRHDGEYRDAVDVGRPWLDDEGRFLGFVGAVFDITDRVRAEMSLREADRRKDEFLAMLAHELRNPLAPVRNAVEVLRLTGHQDPRSKWAGDIITRQVHQLTRLVDDLLDVSRITRGRLELRTERVVLHDLLRAAIETARPHLDRRRHELHVELPEELLALDGDPTRLTQVFANLLHNAVKYTPEGGHLTVSAGRDGGMAVVQVKDDGRGIPPHMLEDVFELFTQVDSAADSARGGLGIGLTLVRRLVVMHGGTVVARSEGEGRGSTLEVRLPLAAALPERATETGATLPVAARVPVRVLVADDNRDAADTLRALLEAMGCVVEVTYDGGAAVAAATRFEPHVALLDIGMPVLDGYATARRIRETVGARVVLAAVTGWGQAEDRRRSAEAGFEHHLVKPVDPDVVRAILELVPVARA